jgi:hypothetical protein
MYPYVPTRWSGRLFAANTHEPRGHGTMDQQMRYLTARACAAIRHTFGRISATLRR